jgi:uncharacterized protein YkuJ
VLPSITDPLAKLANAVGLGGLLGLSGPAVPNEWKELTDGSFKGYVFHVAVPSASAVHGTTRVEIKDGRRLQTIQRPLRDGAQVRDFGREARRFTAEVVFFGDNYQFELQEFKKKLHEGTPGILTLPDQPTAVVAYFESLTESSSHEAGNTKVCNVTWLEHTEVASDQPSTGGVFTVTPDTAKANLTAAVANAQSILQNNPLLKAVRAFEAGLSATRSLTNTVLSLNDGIRNRIKQLDANLKSTLAFAAQGIAVIDALFRGSPQASTTSSSSTAVDPETGQRVVDYLDPTSAPPQPDPLAAPEIDSERPFDPTTITSSAKAEQYVQGLITALQEDLAELLESSGGRVDDVAAAILATINTLQAYLKALADLGGTLVVVPFEMSLLEVMFQNGRAVEELSAVYKRNTHIEDPLIVPQGSVVRL